MKGIMHRWPGEEDRDLVRVYLDNEKSIELQRAQSCTFCGTYIGTERADVFWFSSTTASYFGTRCEEHAVFEQEMLL